MKRIATWAPCLMSRTSSATRLHPCSLLSISMLMSTSSRARPPSGGARAAPRGPWACKTPLPDDLDLGPRLAMNSIACDSDDGLPSSQGPHRKRSGTAEAPACVSHRRRRPQHPANRRSGRTRRTHSSGQKLPVALQDCPTASDWARTFGLAVQMSAAASRGRSMAAALKDCCTPIANGQGDPVGWRRSNGRFRFG
jgi:hypothetical protein